VKRNSLHLIGRGDPGAAPPGAGPMPPVTAWQTELTPELVERLVEAGAIGAFKRQCALACGVKPDLLEWWLAEGMREDAEPLMQELSVRFQSCQQNASLELVEVVAKAAHAGEWEAAVTLLKLRDPLWRGSEKFLEPETAPPELSLQERRRQLVEELRQARLNPLGALADDLRAAGFDLPVAETESDGPLALLARGIPENPD
jgi:hypothetical protein